MADLAPGTRLGAYEIVRELGRGGMGVVYEARDARLGRRVAVKLIQTGAAPELAARFEREMRAAASVTHPNVAVILDVGDVRGAPFLVMEYASGGSLKARLGKEGRIPWAEAARLGAQVASALAAVHAAGFVHRDVKPENILLDDAGRPKLTDFGLAGARASLAARGSLTKTGEMLGTPEYMAPELASAERADAAADLYSLGATLHALVTGRPPFEGQGFALVKKHVMDRPRSILERVPDAPRGLASLVLKLLDKEPSRRGDAAQAALALQAIAGAPTEKKGPKPRARLSVAMLVVAVGAVVAGVVVMGKAPPTAPPVGPPPPVAPPLAPPPPARPPAPSVKPTWIGESRTPRERHEIASVLVTPDAQEVIAGDFAGNVSSWGFRAGDELESYAKQTGVVWAIACSPVAPVLVTGDQDGGVITLHDRTNRGFRFLAPDVEYRSGVRDFVDSHIGRIAFSPDGKFFVVIGWFGRLEVRDAATGNRIAKLVGVHRDTRRAGEHEGDPNWAPNVTAATFSPDGDEVLSADLDGVLVLSSFDGRKIEAKIRQVASGAFGPLQFVTKDTFIANGGGEVHTWSIDRKRAAFVRGPSVIIGPDAQSIAFAPDGHKAAVVSTNPFAMRLLDLDTRTTEDLKGGGHTAAVNSLAFSPDGRYVVSGGNDGTIRLWSAE